MRGCSSWDKGFKLGKENAAVGTANFPSGMLLDKNQDKFA